jgi:predicted MFS family arabinose efflux permease
MQGRIADRYGAKKLIIALTFAFTLIFAALVTVIAIHAPLYVLYPLCAAGGASLPFVRGPSRAIWWRIATGDEERITVSSFEGTIGPLSYASGYLIFAAATLVVGSLAAFAFAGFLLISGASGIATLVSSKPLTAADAPAATKRHFLATLKNRPLLTVLFINFSVFCVHGLLQVSLIARAGGSNASLLLALVLFSTFAYGLIWGARSHPRSPESEQLRAMFPYIVGAVLLAAGGPIWILLIALIFHGATRAPAFTYTYHLSAAYAPAKQRTEAVAWNGSVIWAGTAVGKALGGIIASGVGHSDILYAAIPFAVLATIAAASLRGRGEAQRQLLIADVAL